MIALPIPNLESRIFSGVNGVKIMTIAIANRPHSEDRWHDYSGGVLTQAVLAVAFRQAAREDSHMRFIFDAFSYVFWEQQTAQARGLCGGFLPPDCIILLTLDGGRYLSLT